LPDLVSPSRDYFIYLLGLLTWLGLIVAAPIMASYPSTEPLSRPIYYMSSWFCHQRPERSLSLLGQPLAVCARCTFMYLGVTISSAVISVLPRNRPRRTYLFIAATPLVIDGTTQLLGLRESDNFLRAVTGLIFGAALAFYIAPEAEETVRQLRARIWKKTHH